jgi:hypothetical protein
VNLNPTLGWHASTFFPEEYDWVFEYLPPTFEHIISTIGSHLKMRFLVQGQDGPA